MCKVASRDTSCWLGHTIIVLQDRRALHMGCTGLRSQARAGMAVAGWGCADMVCMRRGWSPQSGATGARSRRSRLRQCTTPTASPSVRLWGTCCARGRRSSAGSCWPCASRSARLPFQVECCSCCLPCTACSATAAEARGLPVVAHARVCGVACSVLAAMSGQGTPTVCGYSDFVVRHSGERVPCRMGSYLLSLPDTLCGM